MIPRPQPQALWENVPTQKSLGTILFSEVAQDVPNLQLSLGSRFPWKGVGQALLEKGHPRLACGPSTSSLQPCPALAVIHWG